MRPAQCVLLLGWKYACFTVSVSRARIDQFAALTNKLRITAIYTNILPFGTNIVNNLFDVPSLGVEVVLIPSGRVLE